MPTTQPSRNRESVRAMIARTPVIRSWTMKPRLPSRLRPQPGSIAEGDLRTGRSPWLHAVHLAWSAWVFLTPLFASGEYGYSVRWLVLTLLSYPLFLALYAGSVIAAPRSAMLCAAGMVALCFVLLPWYPSGLSYFVFGCVMLQPRRDRGIAGYLALLVALNAGLFGFALLIGYPWRALAWLPVITFIIGMLVHFDRIERSREAALRLSHDEVRRLAAVAERERIGRDLHDLLGHTLSLVALKSDLALRLVDRDPDAARSELGDLGHVARDALAQVRGAVSGMRATGVAAEFAAARLLLESDGVALDYRIDESLDVAALAPEAETALAMTVREAATNIQRHARATHVEARLVRDGDACVLRVRDDGRGGTIVPGNGLNGMRERIEQAGGRLHIESARDAGTCVEARVPLRKATAKA